MQTTTPAFCALFAVLSVACSAGVPEGPEGEATTATATGPSPVDAACIEAACSDEFRHCDASSRAPYLPQCDCVWDDWSCKSLCNRIRSRAEESEKQRRQKCEDERDTCRKATTHAKCG